MTECRERQAVFHWLELKIRALGCTKPLLEIILGDIGQVRNLKEIRAMLAKFIFTSWELRKESTIKVIQELERKVAKE